MTDFLLKLKDLISRYHKQTGETGVGNHVTNEINEYLASTPSESYWKKRCELETLKRVKDVCELYSDSSARTLAYHWVCEEISKLEALTGGIVGGCRIKDSSILQ